ncbi:MAG: branched-chain amino acid ABC transporter permease [Pseudomonadota bacterium]
MENLANYIILGIVNGFVYTLIAIGFVLIYKSSGVFNLAQGEMTIFGAYLFYALTIQFNLSIWIGIAGAILFSAMIGLFIERVFLRPLVGQPILSIIILTLALGGLLKGTMVLVWGSNWLSAPPLFEYSDGFRMGQTILVSWGHSAFVITSLIVIILLALFYKFTKSGLAMRVTADDTVVARALGINVSKVLAVCWSISAIVAAVSGVLLTNVIGISYIASNIGFTAMAVALVGGLESLAGMVIIGPVIGIIEYVAAGYLDPLVDGGMREVAPWVVLMIVLIIRPYGLFGWKKIERI